MIEQELELVTDCLSKINNMLLALDVSDVSVVDPGGRGRVLGDLDELEFQLLDVSMQLNQMLPSVIAEQANCRDINDYVDIGYRLQ